MTGPSGEHQRDERRARYMADEGKRGNRGEKGATWEKTAHYFTKKKTIRRDLLFGPKNGEVHKREAQKGRNFNVGLSVEGGRKAKPRDMHVMRYARWGTPKEKGKSHSMSARRKG